MAPHVAARKAHQRLSEFSFTPPKRLLQQYRHETDMPTCLAKVRYEIISGIGQRPELIAVQVCKVVNSV
jgi:hypothetical protein